MIQYLMFLFIYAASLIFTIISLRGLPREIYFVELLFITIALSTAFFSIYLFDKKKGKDFAHLFLVLISINSILRLIYSDNKSLYVIFALFLSFLGLLFLLIKPKPKGKKPDALVRVEKELDNKRDNKPLKPYYSSLREEKKLKTGFKIQELSAEKNEIEGAEKEIEKVRSQKKSFVKQERTNYNDEKKLRSDLKIEELEDEALSLTHAEEELEEDGFIELKEQANSLTEADSDISGILNKKDKEDEIIEELKEDLEKIQKSNNIKFSRSSKSR